MRAVVKVNMTYFCLQHSGILEDGPFSCDPDPGCDPAEFDRQLERAMSYDLHKCEREGCEKYTWCKVTDTGCVKWFCRSHHTERAMEASIPT